jgi:hypothetical protein
MPMDIQSRHFYLSEVRPKLLAKHLQKNEWIFAQYFEPAHERNDEKEYRILFFRNKNRTIFGYKEFFGKIDGDLRAIASRIVSDQKFRETLISDDEVLPKIWKRH